MSSNNSISNTSTKSWTLRELEGDDSPDSDLHSQYDSDYDDSIDSNSNSNHGMILAPHEWGKFSLLFISILGACSNFAVDGTNAEGYRYIYWCLGTVVGACFIGLAGTGFLKIKQMRDKRAAEAAQQQTGGNTPGAAANILNAAAVCSDQRQQPQSYESDSDFDSDSESDGSDSRLALLYKRSEKRGNVTADPVETTNDWIKFGILFAGVFAACIAYFGDSYTDDKEMERNSLEDKGFRVLDMCVKIAAAASYIGCYLSFWYGTRNYRILHIVTFIVGGLITLGFYLPWSYELYNRTDGEPILGFPYPVVKTFKWLGATFSIIAVMVLSLKY